jgi:hypothetical protein
VIAAVAPRNTLSLPVTPRDFQVTVTKTPLPFDQAPPKPRFDRLVEGAVATDPHPYKDLVA